MNENNQRFSPFGSLVSDGRALHELEGAAQMERWFSTYSGRCASINVAFAELEAEFQATREAAALKPDPHPAAFFDQIILRIWRNHLARQLTVRTCAELWPYIEARSKVPVQLPALEQHLNRLDRLVDECLRHRAA